jgi:phenylacetic acid degradation operon negative regulatory protein
MSSGPDPLHDATPGASDGALRPRSGESAKAVTVTVLGEFVLPAGGAVWTGTMLSALGSMGYADRNVRQVLSRLRDDGLLEPERQGRRTRWHLSATGRDLLESGAERIYRFGERAEVWDGQWLLVHCAVPETLRRKRRRLHTRLSFEGFGFLSPTVAVSPHADLEARAHRVLADLDLQDLAVVVAGTTGTTSPDETILERAWNLNDLGQAYKAFVHRFGDVAPTDPAAAFVELAHLVHEWRRFPFLDPEIPHRLLPDDWIGLQARALFEDRRARWRPEAAAWFDQLDRGTGDGG